MRKSIKVIPASKDVMLLAFITIPNDYNRQWFAKMVNWNAHGMRPMIFYSRKTHKLISEFGKNTIAGISSARCTNEENYLIKKFMRTVVGNNNIDCCARVCVLPLHWNAKYIWNRRATNSIEDIKHTDCI